MPSAASKNDRDTATTSAAPVSDDAQQRRGFSVTVRSSEFDELGVKVQRAQLVVGKIRGVGAIDGITVEVDAETALSR